MSRPSVIPRALLAPFLLACVGCAHQWYVVPGPMGTVGKAPPPVEYEEDYDADDGSVWDDIAPTAVTTASVARDPEQATGSSDASEPPPTAKARKRGEDVAKAAGHYLGSSRLRHGGDSFRYDCSGLVMAAHARAGLQLAGSSESMLRMAREAGIFHKRKRPWVGDVVFFENTYDRNGNGRLDDPITHVAVVTDVHEDGTVTMVHKGGRGVTRLVMNLRHPADHSDGSAKEINGYLRARRSSDRRGTRYLAGELWIGFGSFWRVLDGA